MILRSLTRHIKDKNRPLVAWAFNATKPEFRI